MLKSRRMQRGDTLIEVLFAISVFSLVVVGALAIMNQGAAASQRALDILLARQQIDAQAEGLRFLHSEYIAAYHAGITFDTNDAQTSPAEEWYRMTTYIQQIGATQASSLSVGDACPYPPNGSLPTGSFIVNSQTARFMNSGDIFLPAQGVPALDVRADGTLASAQGIWIEAIRSAASADPTQSTAGYIDFHIRACWDSLGLSLPMTLGTIVRLYEPRG